MARQTISAPELSEQLELVALDTILAFGVVAVDAYHHHITRVVCVLIEFDHDCGNT